MKLHEARVTGQGHRWAATKRDEPAVLLVHRSDVETKRDGAGLVEEGRVELAPGRRGDHWRGPARHHGRVMDGDGGDGRGVLQGQAHPSRGIRKQVKVKGAVAGAETGRIGGEKECIAAAGGQGDARGARGGKRTKGHVPTGVDFKLNLPVVDALLGQGATTDQRLTEGVHLIWIQFNAVRWRGFNRIGEDRDAVDKEGPPADVAVGGADGHAEIEEFRGRPEVNARPT